MKVYNVCVKKNLRIYKFTIVASSIAQALEQLANYISLTNKTYRLKSITEAPANA